MNFRFLEHPTDLRMQAWGKDQRELFVRSALGMMSKLAVLIRPGDTRFMQVKTFRLEAPNVEELFVYWLSEILYEFSTHDFYFASAQFATLTDTRLEAKIEGWSATQVKLRKGLEIKAVTYHGLRVIREPRWEAEVILDV